MKSFSLVLGLLGILSTASACAHERIHDVRAARDITREEFLSRLESSEILVVGEKHSTDSIQAAEARLLTDFAGLKRRRVTFAWEFWNWVDQPKLEAHYGKFRSGQIDGAAFQRAMFGEKNPELTYLPLVEAAKAVGADVLATNLTRAEKAPVVKDGIGALDPKLLPPGYEAGSANYRERFFEAAGGHGDPAKLENYFQAQCLVDDVVAYHLERDRPTSATFLVIGGFHSRYFDGVWTRIGARLGEKARTLVEIADPEDEKDWETVLRHPKYGPVADFVIFTR